jgi:hypothetical protein
MRHLPAPPIRGGELLAALLTSLALCACSQGEEADAPSPSPSLTTQALPTTSAGGEPLAPGQWTVEETANGASASFGETGGEPVLRLVCDRDAGTLTLIRIGQGDAPQTFSLEAGTQRAAVEMEPTQTGTAGMLAQVDAGQPVFAAFADPAGTIAIAAPGQPALRLPGHTGISRVIEACK